MSHLAGTWHLKSHHNVTAFLHKIGEDEEFIKGAEEDKPKLSISFPDHEHVVFDYDGKFGKHEEKCKFGSICEHKSLHGRKFKSIITKESDNCMKSDIQDSAHPAHRVYELIDNELHLTSIAGDVKAVSIFTREH
ncbi:unnamed protein product [Calicophoron daubneyi]|uniref:Uncharacterized protein n=1 Tax=Calicophoron daubneyi TaxID=300641 RepID=A0AAV2TSP7_CALDB